MQISVTHSLAKPRGKAVITVEGRLNCELISDTSRRTRLSNGAWADREEENRPPLNLSERSLSPNHLCSHHNIKPISIYIQVVQLRLQRGIYIVFVRCTFVIYTCTLAEPLISKSRPVVNSFCLTYGTCKCVTFARVHLRKSAVFPRIVYFERESLKQKKKRSRKPRRLTEGCPIHLKRYES